MPGPERYRYRLFGLIIASELHLPELAGQPPADAAGADVDLLIRMVREGDLPEGFRLDIPGVARFVISAGRAIAVQPAKGAEEREVRLYLLGSAMGAALHQRGILPLHANAVAIDGRALAFTGRSGIGKSTLAAWFHDEGYPILADDVCVVRTDHGLVRAYPGLPRLRLWEDALEASGRAAADHQMSFHAAGDARQKYDVALEGSGVVREPLPLGALFVLGEGPELRIERLGGSEAVEAISANTYRGRLIGDVGDSAGHVEACLAIARSVPVLRLERPFDRSAFDAQARAIHDYCRSLLPSG